MSETASPSVPEPVAVERAPPKPRRRLRLYLVLVCVLLGAGLFFLWPHPPQAQRPATKTGAKTGTPGRSGGGPIPVVAVRAKKGSIGVFITGLGAVTPIYTVTVRTRVDGQLMAVDFKEGQLVHQGDLLVEIDSRPYAAQVVQSEGALTRDRALLANARVDLARYQTLVKQEAIPEQQLSTQNALVNQYEGIVTADQGQLDANRVNLLYCRITAPITGRVGLRLVDPGNIVHAADTTGLLVITQIHPISVIFTVGEDQLPPILQKIRAGQRLRVDAYDRELKTRIATGSLETVDNEIDQTTGTVKLRANFNNENAALFPNQFVNARLLVQEKNGVTLLPSAAVQRNTQSTYVYLIKPDQTVTVRQVSLGAVEGDQSEIVSGLAPGNAVVMTGVDKLQEGGRVVPSFQ